MQVTELASGPGRTPRKQARRTRLTRHRSILGLAMLVVAAFIVLLPTPAIAADIGYRGPSYAGSTAPTAQKPQSKLWHNDGSWWATMFDAGSHSFTIHELDWATQTWSDTGVLVDERSQAQMDVLWSGSKLYVASAGTSSSASDSGRLYRFSYDSAARTYSLDPGYPVTPVNGGMEAIVMDQDSAGQLWITYTRDSKVYVTHTTVSDGSWVAPFVLPVPGADTLTTDDISALVAYKGHVGVMWGNQNEDSYYFAIHEDGTPESSWTREVAYTRPEGSDDHINIKSIQNDPEGRVFAIVKTSLNDAGDPLNVVLVRKTGGVWDTDNVFGRTQDNETRAIIVIDSQNNQIYAFAAAPCCSGGTVYLKKVSVTGLLNGNPFGTGLGTPFIESTLDPKINNPTSTKQTVSNASELVVLAGDDSTRHYLHNKVDLGPPDNDPPQTTVDSGPSGTVTVDSATFAFSADEPASTFACRLDAGAWEPCTSPHTYSDLPRGSHTFDVRATDPSGNTDPTPATRGWTVDVPLDTTIDDGPSGTVGVTDADFAFSANTSGATFECRLDGAAWESCTSPQSYGGLDDSSHTFDVRASKDGETDQTPASRTWTVDSALPLVVTPAADAGVRQAAPTTNDGDGPRLDADSSPLKESYLRFTVDGVPQGEDVLSATLRLYATNGSGNGPEIHDSGTAWSEGAVTWDTKPSTTNSPVADVGSVPVDTWAEYDVSASVDGNGTYSFGVLPDSSDGTFFSSREGAHPPELVIETGVTGSTPPETTIDSGPSGTVGATAATFGFSSDQNAATFECRLDGSGGWSSCTSPVTETGLSDGSHTFEVRATKDGMTDPTPASRTWTIDSALPLLVHPTEDATIRQANATTNYGKGATLEADTSPVERALLRFDLVGVPAGDVVSRATLRLYATNGTGNGPEVRTAGAAWSESSVTWDSQPTLGSAVADIAAVPVNSWVEYDLTSAVDGDGSYSFALVPDTSDGVVFDSREAARPPELVVETAAPDSSPPDTVIDSGPSGNVGQTGATFAFSADEPGATFECRLDGGGWTACSSTQSYSGLDSGSHTFEVRATDPEQNTDPTPASRTWTVDTALPQVVSPAADATVALAKPNTNYGSTQTLRTDNSPVERAYLKFDVNGVAPGTVASATLRLYATNGSGNGPKVYRTDQSWGENAVTWDTKPVNLGAHVADVGSVPVGDWVEYDVTSVVSGSGTYSFGLVPDSSDAAVFSSREGSSSPQLVIETGGPDTSPPQTSIDSGPSGTVGSTSATFTFSSDEAGSSFECRLDAGSWESCTSPNTSSGLGTGAHTFAVRATDAAGNTDATPASRTWTIDASQPVSTTFGASADARVEERSPDRNYGTLSSLVADGSPQTRSFLSFDVTGVSGTVQSATLRLRVTNGTGNGPSVHEVTSPWTESGVTWNTQPTTAAALDDPAAVPVGTWLELDVTDAVDGNGTVDLALLPQSSDGLFVNSREASVNQPELVVVTAP